MSRMRKRGFSGQNRVFDIFRDTLDKRKSNLGNKCVKRELLSIQGKIRTIFLENENFPVFTLPVHLSSLKPGIFR